MTQATISKHVYRLKVTLPWLFTILFLASITSIITFLVFTSMATNDMRKATLNSTNSESSVYNNSDSFYRELSYQSTVICLLGIITLCVVFYTLKNLL